MFQQWEYLERKDPSEDDLKALGREGWELVAAFPMPSSEDVWYTFKRPLQ